MESSTKFSRRVFIARAAGMVLSLGAPTIGKAERLLRPTDPFASGVWLAGDHHIHTKYSYDGEYEIGQQVRNAVKYGLNWCAITDHGGPHHDKVAREMAYPELVKARRDNPSILVFQGLEWNIPSAEHGSVILPPTESEAEQIALFEALYDEKNLSRPDVSHSTEADAVNAVRYLQSLTPKPLFIANHPARRGLDSPHEMRNWSDAGPDVARGFEGAPGHAACTLVGRRRGEYDKTPGKGAFPGYPLESYRTWGGYDWYVAKVGGLWDSLLGEGRPWYITANSDSHRHWDDRKLLDFSTYLTRGYVTDTGKTTDQGTDFDFYPGEYTKTWVHATRREPLAILDALRNGRMFTVLGDLIDRLEFSARSESRWAPMGDTLMLDRQGENVDVTVRLRVPARPNWAGRRPTLHHVDLIAGDILGPAADRDAMENPTTKVDAQLGVREARREGPFLVFTHRFPNVRKGFYVRVRGASTPVDAPRMDPVTVDPWEDLWFYGNPVFVRVPG